MKLNYKRTVLVGLAFFLICAFWQAYDNTIPLILTNKFGMSQALSGVIMALDNILAVHPLGHDRRGGGVPLALARGRGAAEEPRRRGEDRRSRGALRDL